MSINMGFSQWWIDYENRTDQSECIAYFLMKLLPKLHLEKARNILSIGPASSRIEKILMKETLVGVHHAYCVEPTECFRENFVQMMKGFHVKATGFSTIVQEFDGPVEEMDLIFVTHVAYYFHQTFMDEMKKLLKMLSTNGALIFATKDDDDFNKMLVSLLPKSNHGEDFSILPSVDKFYQDFMDIGAKVQVFETRHMFDISKTTHGDASYLSLLVNRMVTETEVHTLKQKWNKLSVDKSTKLQLKDKIFVVTKQSIEQ